MKFLICTILLLASSLSLANHSKIGKIQSEFRSVFNDLKSRKNLKNINVIYLKYLAVKRFLPEDEMNYSDCEILDQIKCGNYRRLANNLKTLMQGMDCPSQSPNTCRNLFDFLEMHKKSDHLRELEISYGHSSADSDLTWERSVTISSPHRVYRESLLNTCIEYIKAFVIGYKKQLKATNPHHWQRIFAKAMTEWKVVYLYSSKDYQKVCPNGPSKKGYQPDPNHFRPFVHTAIAVKRAGNWYLLNPEVYSGQEELEVKKIGRSLSGHNHREFRLENLYTKWFGIKGAFKWRAVVELDDFVAGFDGQELVNIGLSGKKDIALCR